MSPPHAFIVLMTAAAFCACMPTGRRAHVVNGQLLRAGTDTMLITRIEGGRERPGGWAISTVSDGQRGELDLRYRYEAPGQPPVVVMTRLTRATLLPIEEIHDYGAGDSVIVHFSRGGAVGERRHGDSSGWYAPDTSAHDAFSSAAIDLVLRALPLRAGFRDTLPVYYMPLNRTARVPVAVLDSQAIRTRSGALVECWRLRARFPGGAVEQFWIAKASRDLMRVLGHLSPDVQERYDR